MTDRLLVGGFWLALLFTTYSAFAPPNLVRAPHFSDMVLHAVAFFMLANLLQMAYLPRRAALAAALLVGYAVLIELVQLGLPDRSGEMKDLLFGGLGIVLGLLAYRVVGQRLIAALRLWLN
ncbi:MAG: VanZ family protein [Pseudomonadales bacterium]